MTISGSFFQANRGRRFEAELRTHDNGSLTCVINHKPVAPMDARIGAIANRPGMTPTDNAEAPQVLTVRFEDVDITPRVANVARRICFEDGAVFETRDNDAVDRLLALYSVDKPSRRLYQLESRWPFTIGALCVVALSAWLLVIKIIPAATPVLSAMVPPQVEEDIGERIVSAVEQRWPLIPVASQPAKWANVRQRFVAMTQEIESVYNYRLAFLEADFPNAFALPGGRIYVTRELMSFATEDEVVGILAHEIGHVEGRHSLNNMIQQAGTLALLSTLFGDVGGSTLLVYGPLIFTRLHYSRGTEMNADEFAVGLMLETNQNPGVLADFFERLQKKSKLEIEDAGDGESDNDYLSTHPSHENRIRFFRDAAIAP